MQPIVPNGVSQSAMIADADVRRLVDIYDRFRFGLYEAVASNLGILEREPAWGLLHSMSDRVIEQQSACIALYSHDYIAPAEALCRTVIEGAVNLYYCSLGDSVKLVLTYFRSYIETERRQNRQWLSSVNSSAYSEDEKGAHRERVVDKERALLGYESVLREAFSQIGESYDEAGTEWPSIFDRFREIRKEVDYRTVYAALCSQAHNDPEDLLNGFVHKVMQAAEAQEAQAYENKNFSLYMVVTALSYLVEANAMYLAKFDLGTNKVLLPILKEANAFISEVAERKFARKNRDDGYTPRCL